MRKVTLIQAAMLIACSEEGGASHSQLLAARRSVGASDDPMALVGSMGRMLCGPLQKGITEISCRRTKKFAQRINATRVTFGGMLPSHCRIKRPLRFKGWVDRKKNSKGRFRYFLTELGKQVLTQWADENVTTMEEFDWRPNVSIPEDCYQ